MKEAPNGPVQMVGSPKEVVEFAGGQEKNPGVTKQVQSLVSLAFILVRSASQGILDAL